ncbi:unnamed protein product, partial [Gadus morhua 'NCC']
MRSAKVKLCGGPCNCRVTSPRVAVIVGFIRGREGSCQQHKVEHADAEPRSSSPADRQAVSRRNSPSFSHLAPDLYWHADAEPRSSSPADRQAVSRRNSPSFSHLAPDLYW